MADISKITPLGSQTTYNLKDTTAREQANWNTNNGVKNFLNFDADTMKSVNTGGTWSGNTWSLGNNVTLTINSDKSITLNGTANAGKTVYLTKNLGMAENAYTLSTGALTTKLWAGIIEVGGTENNYTGSTTHFDKTCQPNHITLYIESGCTLSNLTIYPMLTLKSLYDADPTYEPYALPNTKITPELIELVDSGAKNKLDNSYADTQTGSAINGVTYTKQADGSYKATGTPSATSRLILTQANPAVGYINITPYNGMMFTCLTSTGSNSTYGADIIYYNSSNEYVNEQHDYGSGVTITVPATATKAVIRISIYTGAGQNINLTFKPMICSKAAWDVSQKYVPYRPTYEETVEQVAENENNILSKIGASDYATQTTGGTVRVWTTTSGGETTLHIANEAPTP